MLVIPDLRIKVNHPDALPAILKKLNKPVLDSEKDDVEFRLFVPRYKHLLRRRVRYNLGRTKSDYVRIGVMMSWIASGRAAVFFREGSARCLQPPPLEPASGW